LESLPLEGKVGFAEQNSDEVEIVGVSITLPKTFLAKTVLPAPINVIFIIASSPFVFMELLYQEEICYNMA